MWLRSSGDCNRLTQLGDEFLNRLAVSSKERRTSPKASESCHRPELELGCRGFGL